MDGGSLEKAAEQPRSTGFAWDLVRVQSANKNVFIFGRRSIKIL